MTGKKKSFPDQTASVSELQGLVTMLSQNLHPSAYAIKQSPFDVADRPQYFAAIDLGSNTCRLLITKKHNHQFTTQDVSSRIVRLAEGLSQTNRLSEMAMQRTLNVIGHYARKIREYGTINVMAITTEACRRASNADAFLDRIYRRTGIQFDILSETEEAFFVAKGCAPLMNAIQPYGLFIDIGGGSTEIIWTKQRQDHLEIIDSISLPFGVVQLSETIDTQKAINYQSIFNEVANTLTSFKTRNRIADRIEEGVVQMIGTSGTTTTLAAINMDLRAYDRRKVDRSYLGFQEIERVTKSLQLMSESELVMHPCIGSERSELILAGTAILGGICKAFPVGSLQVADRGVRDGMVSFMAYGDQKSPDHRQAEPNAIFVA